MDINLYKNILNLDILTAYQNSEDINITFVSGGSQVEICVYDFVENKVLKGSSGLFKNGFARINKDTTITTSDLSAVSVSNISDTYICFRDPKKSASTSSTIIKA